MSTRFAWSYASVIMRSCACLPSIVGIATQPSYNGNDLEPKCNNMRTESIKGPRVLQPPIKLRRHVPSVHHAGATRRPKEGASSSRFRRALRRTRSSSKEWKVMMASKPCTGHKGHPIEAYHCAKFFEEQLNKLTDGVQQIEAFRRGLWGRPFF